MKQNSSTRVTLNACLTILALLFFFFGCTDRTNREGAELYAAHCQGCHGDRGQGLRQLYPALTGSDYLTTRLGELPCLISKGMPGSISASGTGRPWRMPQFTALGAEDISSLITYMHDKWSAGNSGVAAEQVEEWLSSCR